MSIQNEKKTVLVVEDNQSLLTAIQEKLERNEFAVITARTIEQALIDLGNIPRISAIWLDHYLLGREDGIDFVQKIKQNDSAWKNIPVFVVSNTVGPDKVEIYIRLGVVKYYTKAEMRLDGIVDDIKNHLQNIN
jgi:CheY-like chemotaxis protein